MHKLIRIPGRWINPSAIELIEDTDDGELSIFFGSGEMISLKGEAKDRLREALADLSSEYLIPAPEEAPELVAAIPTAYVRGR